MHPAFAAFWHATGHGCGPAAWFGGRCGPGGRGPGGPPFGGDGGGDQEGGFGGGGGPFGVRRPLRFLAYKLELEDAQVAELATILDELKIERAQASVDHRRSTAAYAEIFNADKLDDTKLEQSRADRVRTAERLEAAVSRAIGKIHALLDPEQRKKLAYLLRTGALTI